MPKHYHGRTFSKTRSKPHGAGLGHGNNRGWVHSDSKEDRQQRYKLLRGEVLPKEEADTDKRRLKREKLQVKLLTKGGKPDGRGGLRPNAGRKPGSTNKVSSAWREEVIRAGKSPLHYFYKVMWDETATPKRRDNAAKQTLPYFHAQLAALVRASGEDPEVGQDFDLSQIPDATLRIIADLRNFIPPSLAEITGPGGVGAGTPVEGAPNPEHKRE